MTDISRKGRSNNELRPLKLTCNPLDYPAGSVLIEFGKTKVLCAVSLVPGVPSFLRNKGKGWLTAEYSMLPAATSIRTARESVTLKRSGRSVEISRMIGRSLRLVVDLDKIGERTIHIDCDVIQADGGTRSAAITGACQALLLANKRWVDTQKIDKSIINNEIVAISAGVQNGNFLVDLDAAEDNNIATDINFVFTKNGNLVEVQGTAEQEPVSWDDISSLFSSCKSEAVSLFSKLDILRDSYLNKKTFHKKDEQSLKNSYDKPLKNPIKFIKD